MEVVYVYHGDTNERQGNELHMVKKEEEKGKIAANRTRASVLQTYSRPFGS